MFEFSTSLLREKYVIKEIVEKGKEKEPLIALSNRLYLPLKSPIAGQEEEFVVRAQNMHTTLRIAAQMARDFYETGPLMDRKKPYDWEYTYLKIIKGYEKKFNPDRWIVIYHKGRPVYSAGEVQYHPFLDIIEKCDARSKSGYETSMEIAKDAFKQAGKLVNLEHDSNVALIVNITPDEGKLGAIVRGPNRTTTFNMSAKRKAGRDVKISQCLSVAAAFLEGIQLAFFIGFTEKKLSFELVEPGSDDAKKASEARKKLGRLNGAVQQFENMFDVSYRPDRPNFAKLIDEAEEFGHKVLGKEVEEKVKAGEMSDEDWVV